MSEAYVLSDQLVVADRTNARDEVVAALVVAAWAAIGARSRPRALD
jgi:hypothetical protein